MPAGAATTSVRNRVDPGRQPNDAGRCPTGADNQRTWAPETQGALEVVARPEVDSKDQGKRLGCQSGGASDPNTSIEPWTVEYLPHKPHVISDVAVSTARN
jgi:hypothetical protein